MRIPRLPVSAYVPGSTASSSVGSAPPITTKDFRSFKVPGVTCFRPSFFPDPRPAFSTQTILDDPYHVLHLKMKRRIEARDKNTLWTMVYTANSVAPQRTVRSYCNRKMKRALAEALALRGYDYNGRLLQSAETREDGRSTNLANGSPLFQRHNLKGSLVFQVLEPMITTKQEDVNAEAKSVVEEMIRLCEPYPLLSGSKPLKRMPGTARIKYNRTKSRTRDDAKGRS